jgi:hypothetical protein
MFRNTFSGVNLAMLGAAVFFLTAEPARAQPQFPRYRGRMVIPYIPSVPQRVYLPGPYHYLTFGGNGAHVVYHTYPARVYYGHYHGATLPSATRHGGAWAYYGAYSPYPAYHGNPYRHYSGGYGYGGYGDGDGSSGYSPYYQSSYSGYSTAAKEPARNGETNESATVLTASGVPTEDGRPAWPLGLRILPGEKAQTLRGQIDALLQVAATQAAQGGSNTAVADELASATDQLRKLLVRHRQEQGGLAEHTYAEAERFLNNVARVPKLLRSS